MKVSKERWWNETDRVKPKYSEKPRTNAPLSTINLAWTELGSSLGLRGDSLATTRLSHGAAL